MRVFVTAIVLLSGVMLHTIANANPQLRAVEELQWGYLNPARGDKGPAAADLWGDRTDNTASGILLRFPPGFSSPEHIHNVSYRGVVIEGELHNDDAAAEALWMPPGSYWTQPAGASHITAANGRTNIAFIEIDRGPYRVLPTEQAHDNGERPLNLHSLNLVWLRLANERVGGDSEVFLSYLWGDPVAGELHGAMIKVPAGFVGELSVSADEFRAVVIDGVLIHSGVSPQRELAPGSYFGSSGSFAHAISAAGNDEVTLYVRTDGQYHVRKD